MANMTGQIYQLNQKSQIPGERGIPKSAVEEARITLSGLAGDYNVYRAEKKQNRLEAALMLMPLEMIEQLHSEGWPIQPGHLGENITTQGIFYDSFAVGKHYRVGEAVIEISEPCTPCTNLQLLPYVGKGKVMEFMQMLAKPVNRRGWYARVLQEGTVRRYDTIEELLL